MKSIKLTRYEAAIEKDLLAGVYEPVSEAEFKKIAASLARRKKDAVLNIRVNRQDLDSIKSKAKKLGLKYHTFISEILHKVAM